MKRLLRQAWLAFALRAETALSRFRRAAVGRHVSALLIDCEQGRFLARPEDWTVGGLMARTGRYGTEEIARLRSLTDANSRVLVVGSHIGALVVPLARHVAHVTAVEANPDTFELLALNLGLNGCANVQALQLAAGDREGEIDFVLHRGNSGGSKRLPLVRRDVYFHDKPEVRRVRMGLSLIHI